MKNLIIIEWIDFSWKTTLWKLLDNNLSNSIYYKTPWNWKIPELEKQKYDLENISVQERYDFYISNLINDQEKIKELIENEWKIVICDRYLYSTISHPKVFNSNINFHSIDEFCIKQSIKILLIINEEDIKLRSKQRENKTRFEKDIKSLLLIQEYFKQNEFDLIIDTSKNDINQTLNLTLNFLKSLKFQIEK